MKNRRKKKQSFGDKCKKIFTWNNIKPILLGKSTGRRMFRLYFVLILFFSAILYLPISFQPFVDGGWSENFKFENGSYIMALSKLDPYNGAIMVDEPITFRYMDCLFLSFSSFSDTGLTPIDLFNSLSIFGKIVLMLEIEVGGFGVMFFIFMFWKIFKRTNKVTFNQQLMAQSEKGNTKIGNTEKMLIQTVIVVITIQIIFGLFFSLWFLYVPAYEQVLVPNTFGIEIVQDSTIHSYLYGRPGYAFMAGFFHSITAINNAGFDIIGEYSLSGYSRGIHTFFLLMTVIEFVIGGIGFPVIFDILAKFKIEKYREINKKTISKKLKKNEMAKKVYTIKVSFNRNYRISLLSKVAILGYVIVSVLGIALMFLFEYTSIGGEQYLFHNTNSIFGEEGTTMTEYNKAVNIIFQSMSTRSAGYYTFNNQLLSPVSKWLNISLMFIGGSPSSTAGGIRVTTFMIMFIVLWHKIKGSKNAHIFKRTLTTEDIVNSFIVLLTSLILLCIGSAILLNNITDINGELETAKHTVFSDAMFMVASAFGTTGLSTVDVSRMAWYSQLYLMLLMFVGQCGVSSTVLAFRRNKIKDNMFSYLSESIKIG